MKYLQSLCQASPLFASPGWYPLMASTQYNKIEVLHRAAYRVISGCLSSPTDQITGGSSSSSPGLSFPSGYLLFRVSFTSTITVLHFARTGLEPCQEASQMSFLALPLSGAGFTTLFGHKRTADSVSPVPTTGPSILHSFYLHRRLFSLLLHSSRVCQVSPWLPSPHRYPGVD